MVLVNPELLQQSAYTVPDFTKEITPLSDHYCDAGGFSDVYKCHLNDRDGVKMVAVKAFRFKFLVSKPGGSKEKVGKMIRREMGIWKRISHPNIVPFLGITYGFGREGNVSLVSLWMPNGTLYTLLDDYSDQLLDVYRLQLLLDISNGLSYLHSFSEPQPIVHGDLSCSNVLLDGDYTARLVDFGLSSAVGDMPEALAYLERATKGHGLVRWAAPEQFHPEHERTTKSDIYSLGNLVFFVLTGNCPWPKVQENAVMYLLFQGQKPARPESRPIQDAQWELIQQCWASIDARPSAAGVASTLKNFLQSHPTPKPLREFLDGILPSSSNSLSGDEDFTSSGSKHEIGREFAGHLLLNGTTGNDHEGNLETDGWVWISSSGDN